MRSFLILLFVFAGKLAQAQQVESIYVNLYTDSLKKGTFNYINIDGKTTSGKYLPLDSSALVFSASAGRFEGNSLWIDRNFTGEKVMIKVVLRSNPQLHKEFEVYIKTKPDPELKTMDEIMKAPPTRKPGRKA